MSQFDKPKMEIIMFTDDVVSASGGGCPYKCQGVCDPDCLMVT